MSNRILFCTGEGIGNVVQTIPVIRTLREVMGYRVDMWHAFGSFKVPKIIPYVDNWFISGKINNLKKKQYVGLVSTFWTRQYISRVPLRNLTKITPLSMFRSEVDTYMDIARYLKVPDEKILWYGNCVHKKVKPKYDVVLHNGYNPNGAANWKIKGYPQFAKVAKLLSKAGVKVCSVGAKSEHLAHTANMTDKPLLESLGVIKNAKLFVGTDSGLYHCANALGVPNIVIFTATSIAKNYDSRFHKFSTIIGRDDLECRPCQAGRKWKRCKDWKCQQIPPAKVFQAVMEKLDGI